MSSKTTDEDLVSTYLRTQNTAYFNLLYKRYSGKVYGKCLSILKSEARAEDATQEVFMKVLLNLSKFSGKSRFSTWLYSITYNFCIDTIRREKKNPTFSVDEIHETYDTVDEVDDQFLLETSVKRLGIVLNQMKAGDKAILLMKYQDGMSIKDIGAILDKSESAIKMKIKRAKQKFRDIHDDLFKHVEI